MASSTRAQVVEPRRDASRPLSAVLKTHARKKDPDLLIQERIIEEQDRYDLLAKEYAAIEQSARAHARKIALREWMVSNRRQKRAQRNSSRAPESYRGSHKQNAGLPESPIILTMQPAEVIPQKPVDSAPSSATASCAWPFMRSFSPVSQFSAIPQCIMDSPNSRRHPSPHQRTARQLTETPTSPHSRASTPEYFSSAVEWPI